MNSLSFPNIFESTSSTGVVKDKDASMQDLKLLLSSEKGELFGDPFFGVRIKKYTFNQNTLVNINLKNKKELIPLGSYTDTSTGVNVYDFKSLTNNYNDFIALNGFSTGSVYGILFLVRYPVFVPVYESVTLS